MVTATEENSGVLDAGPRSLPITHINGAPTTYNGFNSDKDRLVALNVPEAITTCWCKVQLTETIEEEFPNVGSPVTEISLTAAAVVTGCIDRVTTSGRLHMVSDDEMDALALA